MSITTKRFFNALNQLCPLIRSRHLHALVKFIETNDVDMRYFAFVDTCLDLMIAVEVSATDLVEIVNTCNKFIASCGNYWLEQSD